jgi:hypothetical protein
LPEDTKYAFLDEKKIYHVIISVNLSCEKETMLRELISQLLAIHLMN